MHCFWARTLIIRRRTRIISGIRRRRNKRKKGSGDKEKKKRTCREIKDQGTKRRWT